MKQLFSLLICSIVATAMYAQARSQADVSVTSVTLGAAITKNATIANPTKATPVTPVSGGKNIDRIIVDNLKCSITVHNENDDDAYETVLVAVLPVEVAVVSLPAGAVVHKSSPSSPFAGYITFNLGHMTVGQNITVEFTFSKSKFGNKVGGYAYSGTPDPNPANNYKDATF
jgi:hypothetical protein